MGRKTKFDSETKEKIKYCYSRGLNDAEASLQAGISSRTLYNYFAKHPKFKEECEQLKVNLKMHAKLNIAESIIDKKNLETSKYYYDKVSENDLNSSVLHPEEEKQEAFLNAIKKAVNDGIN